MSESEVANGWDCRTDLDRVRQHHQMRSRRMQSVLRFGLITLMVAAMLFGTPRDQWAGQSILLGFYSLLALWAYASAFFPASVSGPWEVPGLALAITDVAAVSVFGLLSTAGYLPLLTMGVLPLLIALYVSLPRAAIILTFSVGAFAYSVLQDPAIEHNLGWPETAFLIVIYGFACAAAFSLVYVRARYVDEIAVLTASREELLADTMTAEEAERRRISEAIHDGPLQDVLFARQELVDLAAKVPPNEEIDRALASLAATSRRLREATFELHPAVLEHVGLAAAVDRLATATTDRSGIDITTDVDYPVKNAIDPIVFGVIRELLSNVVRHSGADTATVMVRTEDHMCRVDIIDNGVGLNQELLTERLAEGHIGWASHRARIEAAGGMLTVMEATAGTHIRMMLPLR